MKPSEIQKKEVRKYVEKWRLILFLNQWRFDILYADEESECTAEIKMNGAYREAGIFIYDKYWKQTKEKREFSIVHELTHCVIQPLIEIACASAEGQALSIREIDWNKEQVTQHIANSLFYK